MDFLKSIKIDENKKLHLETIKAQFSLSNKKLSKNQ
jgi:hypothetical protein